MSANIEKARIQVHIRVAPVCVFMCIRSELGRLKRLRQHAQVCLRSSSCEERKKRGDGDDGGEAREEDAVDKEDDGRGASGGGRM